MKLYEAPPEPPAEVGPLATAEPVESVPVRRWWRSRTARVGLASLVLLVALAIAVEPWVRRQIGVMTAQWYAVRGEAEFLNGDLPAALELLDQSVAWAPEDPAVRYVRAVVRAENDDLQGALADFNEVVKLSPTYASGYSGRANVYQRMRRYPEAIDDLTTALRNRPKWDPEGWNERAYVRALAGVDLQAALDDVEEAIRLSPDENANYLDTRGLIHHKLEDQDRALDDLNRAIQLTEAQREQWRLQAEKDAVDPRRRNARIAYFDRALAVMYQHRSLVHAALENAENSEKDAAQARQLGYDPSRGIE